MFIASMFSIPRTHLFTFVCIVTVCAVNEVAIAGATPAPLPRGHSKKPLFFTQPVNIAGSLTSVPTAEMGLLDLTSLYVTDALVFQQTFERVARPTAALLDHLIADKAFLHFGFLPELLVGKRELGESATDSVESGTADESKAGTAAGSLAAALIVVNYMLQEYSLGAPSFQQTNVCAPLFSEKERAFLVANNIDWRNIYLDMRVIDYVVEVAHEQDFFQTHLPATASSVVELKKRQRQLEELCSQIEIQRRDQLLETRENYLATPGADSKVAAGILKVSEKVSVPRNTMLSASTAYEVAVNIATQIAVSRSNALEATLSRLSNYRARYLVSILPAHAVTALKTPTLVPYPQRVLRDQVALAQFLEPLGCALCIEAANHQEARIEDVLRSLGAPPNTVFWCINCDYMWRNLFARQDAVTKAAIATVAARIDMSESRIVPAQSHAESGAAAGPSTSAPAAAGALT